MTNTPTRKPRKQGQLEALARTLIGDHGSPDLFFVTDRGRVVTVTRDGPTAYAHWCRLAYPTRNECALENRQYGVLASVAPDSDEPGARLIVIDDTPDR